MIRKIFYILSIYSVTLVLSSCSKLDEQVLDETSSAGATDKEIAEGTIGPVYAICPDCF